MKYFRQQFKECTENKVYEIRKLSKPQVIETAFHGTFEFDKMTWCKRFSCQCSSGVCEDYRKAYNLN